MTDGILCPSCATPDSKTVDSRPHSGGWRRRRTCVNGHRFTTIEVVTTEKPRTLVGLKLFDLALAKQKLIARITATLESAL